MSKTIDYYNNNAADFVSGTIKADVTYIQDKFLSRLPAGALILDFGCGSGRDTKYFIKEGFRAEAIDGSEELCKIASANTGIEVKCMLFGELDEKSKYDGIWACASVLHLPKDELKDVLSRMVRAVKNKGYIYLSFKYGEYEGFRKGRFFTDFTQEGFGEFIKNFPELVTDEQWVSADVRPGRGEEKWLNLILKKVIQA